MVILHNIAPIQSSVIEYLLSCIVKHIIHVTVCIVEAIVVRYVDPTYTTVFVINKESPSVFN